MYTEICWTRNDFSVILCIQTKTLKQEYMHKTRTYADNVLKDNAFTITNKKSLK